MPLRDGKTLTTGIMVYRIGNDGRLTFVRKYDVAPRRASSSGAAWSRWDSVRGEPQTAWIVRSEVAGAASLMAQRRRVVAAAGLEPALRFPRSRF